MLVTAPNCLFGRTASVCAGEGTGESRLSQVFTLPLARVALGLLQTAALHGLQARFWTGRCCAVGCPLAPVSPGSGALTSWLVTSPALCVFHYSPPDLKALKEASAQRRSTWDEQIRFLGLLALEDRAPQEAFTKWHLSLSLGSLCHREWGASAQNPDPLTEGPCWAGLAVNRCLCVQTQPAILSPSAASEASLLVLGEGQHRFIDVQGTEWTLCTSWENLTMSGRGCATGQPGHMARARVLSAGVPPGPSEGDSLLAIC